MLDDYEFALCLTHDVDRPYETFQAPYYAAKHRAPSRLASLLSNERPYWQFEEIMELEDELGVRSSFYFLEEKRLFRDKLPSAWFRPRNWIRYTGRYSVTDSNIAEVIATLDEGGWEVGLHGSYDSFAEPDRLSEEKRTLERVLGSDVSGVRQHYLNLKRPETWQYQRRAGLRYDSSLGSATSIGFDHGYKPLRPFDDDFLVFPPTIMDAAVMDTGNFEEARNSCIDLLHEAERNNAVMTIIWHPKVYYEPDFPGYRNLYVEIVNKAKDLSAWIGPCRDLYASVTQQKPMDGIDG